MASRRKPVPRPRLSSTGSRRRSATRQHATRPADSATRRWRRDTRPRSIRAAVSATKALRWTRPLIEAVLEEL